MVKKRRIGAGGSSTSRGILMMTRRSLASAKEKILLRILGAVPGKCIGVSEAAVSFHFLFDCMRHFAFSDGVAEAEIVLGDQVPGLIAAMPISMPNCKLQHCNWHVSQNIKKRLAEKKYLAEERNTIMNHVWWYLHSASKANLVENRKRLLEMVRPSEKSYMIEH